jgi:hypothetical protein
MSFDKKIIFEQAFSGGEVQLIEESVLPGGQYKCIFRAKLQEADVVNNNRRVYPAETLQQVYVQLKEKAQSRKLVGELDHPQPQGDQASKIKRSSTISLEKACFLIRELEWDGNSIYGVCETLSSRAGMDLYALLKDKVTIGFSLRAFGETRKRPDGITEVLPKGIKALTYDCVANPSHDSSVILEMLQENSDAASVVKSLGSTILEETAAIEAKKEMGLIEESGMATQLGETDKPICVGNICSIAPLEEAIEYILDQVVADTSIPNVKVNKF